MEMLTFIMHIMIKSRIIPFYLITTSILQKPSQRFFYFQLLKFTVNHKIMAKLTREDVIKSITDGNKDFEGLDLSGLDLSVINHIGANFGSVNFVNANLAGANLEEVNLFTGSKPRICRFEWGKSGNGQSKRS